MICCVIKIDGDDHVIRPNGDTPKRAEYYGLSTDTKPTKGVNNADVFFEMDTGSVFVFDEENQVWLPL